MYKNFINHLIKKSDFKNTDYFPYNENRTSPEKKKFSLEYEKLINPIFSNYIVLDFETTGFSYLENKILEIGALKVLNNKIHSKFETLINPNTPIPPFISSKINITDEMVKNKPKIEEVFENFVSFLENYPLVIHNAKFDMSFLLANANNLNIKINKSALDTLATTRKLFPELKKYNLSFLCKNFQISNINAHRAMSDAIATHYLYEILYKKYNK